MERNLETERYLLLIEQLVEKWITLSRRSARSTGAGRTSLKAAKERVHLRSEL
jgi:hypothetical protein